MYGGRAGSQKKANQEMQDQNALKYGKENMVQRTVSKSSHVYKNDSWDLIDASSEKNFDITKINTEELPENMRNMSRAEQLKYISLKKQERENIQKQISELNQKRVAYVAKQQTTGNDLTLETVMIKAIRKQASSKNFTFW